MAPCVDDYPSSFSFISFSLENFLTFLLAFLRRIDGSEGEMERMFNYCMISNHYRCTFFHTHNQKVTQLTQPFSPSKSTFPTLSLSLSPSLFPFLLLRESFSLFLCNFFLARKRKCNCSHLHMSFGTTFPFHFTCSFQISHPGRNRFERVKKREGT